MTKAFAATSLTALFLVLSACDDGVTPLPVEDGALTIAFAPGGQDAISASERAQFRRAAAHMAKNGHSQGAIFMPSGTFGFTFAEFPDFTGPPLRVCGFFGEATSDFMRINPDGTASLHWVSSDATAILFPILADEPAYEGTGRARMSFTGILETVSIPGGPTFTFIGERTRNAQAWSGVGRVLELDEEGNPVGGKARTLHCGLTDDANGNRRRGGIRVH